MDHHCPWINNCVGELNLKYFFLFVMYSGLLCLYGSVLITVEWLWNREESAQDSTTDKVITVIAFFEAMTFGLFILVVGSGQTVAVLCDRNAIEIKRYGHPMGFPKTPKMALVQAVCGRGPRLLWLLPCVNPRIPDPVPPAKLSTNLFNGLVQTV
jgi:cytochrome bd-type quinol oxidase subunit 2